MYFVFICGNRMKPVEIVLKRGGKGEEGGLWGVSTYVNITMYTHI
jgi:hypothetical protein